jgi:uncharacterized protein (TIGR03437 family)
MRHQPRKPSWMNSPVGRSIRRFSIVFSILILIWAGFTAVAGVKAKPTPSLASPPAIEADSATAPGGRLSELGVAQTSVFLTIISRPPYIVEQSIILKGGVSPGRSGTMSFYAGTKLLGSAPLQLELNGSMQAQLSAQGLAEGLHVLTAVYDGDGAVSQSKPILVISRASSVSAANYRGEGLAPEQIVATYGSRLSTLNGQESASGLPLPTTLAGTTVNIIDSAGTSQAAPLLYVSSGQVNHLIPGGVASGPATIMITPLDGNASAVPVEITAVTPGLFSADTTGKGTAAAQVLRVKADGSSSYEPIAEYDRISGKYSALPIDLGVESDQVFLILYGTGFRHRNPLLAATATIGGIDVDVLYAGSQGVLAGLDQANLRLPRSLIGRGVVDVVFTVDKKAANTVTISLR